MIYLDRYEITPTIFNDNTSQVWKLSESVLESLERESTLGITPTITWIFENEGEIFHLATLKKLLDKKGVKSKLFIPTLPYARQDKDITNNSTFALHVFADMINAMKFENVRATDVHNISKTSELIKNFKNVPAEPLVIETFKKTGADMIMFPDRGAKERYSLGEYDSVCAEKMRDPETGYIEGYVFDADVTGRKVLIVDDLCDRGGTFLLAYDALKRRGAKEVYLYTSHGLYSGGVNLLFDKGIDRIFNKDGEVYGDEKDSSK